MFISAARGLLRKPALALAATATLALGIGAATALFSRAAGCDLVRALREAP